MNEPNERHLLLLFFLSILSLLFMLFLLLGHHGVIDQGGRIQLYSPSLAIQELPFVFICHI